MVHAIPRLESERCRAEAMAAATLFRLPGGTDSDT
ncbi:hypothetical protein N826_06465 [Skermanella aerolata KACC 11604]|nr:hypothetical protein N826_06465 [Skermanella aerolata KACC 11604]